LTDPDLFHRLSRNSIRRSCETFCHEKITSQYESLYRQLIGSGSS